MGFRNLTGIEYGQIPFDLSVRNVGSRARLIHGDATRIDLSPYDAIFFFNPFRGKLAEQFFEEIPGSIGTVLTINHDVRVEPTLTQLGFSCAFAYAHPIYKNFNGKIWKR
jgi:hypothetical protein